MRDAAERFRRSIEATVAGSEARARSEAQAAICVFDEARLLSQLQGNALPSGDALTLLEKAIRDLEASDRELKRLIQTGTAKYPALLETMQDIVETRLNAAIAEKRRATGSR